MPEGIACTVRDPPPLPWPGRLAPLRYAKLPSRSPSRPPTPTARPRTHPPHGAASCRAAREPPSASRARPRQPRRLPPARPRSNPLPVSAFSRGFEPGNGPGRHRENPSPAGFCSPQKTKPVSFSTCLLPEGGKSRRLYGHKPLMEKHFRADTQTEKRVTRNTFLVTRHRRTIPFAF